MILYKRFYSSENENNDASVIERNSINEGGYEESNDILPSSSAAESHSNRVNSTNNNMNSSSVIDILQGANREETLSMNNNHINNDDNNDNNNVEEDFCVSNMQDVSSMQDVSNTIDNKSTQTNNSCPYMEIEVEDVNKGEACHQIQHNNSIEESLSTNTNKTTHDILNDMLVEFCSKRQHIYIVDWLQSKAN